MSLPRLQQQLIQPKLMHPNPKLSAWKCFLWSHARSARKDTSSPNRASQRRHFGDPQEMQHFATKVTKESLKKILEKQLCDDRASSSRTTQGLTYGCKKLN